MKHWVFDLDGTLVDSLSVHFNVMKAVFSKYNIPFEDKHYNEVLKINAQSLSSYFESRFGKENLQESKDFFINLSNEAIETIKPFEGIVDLLQTLQNDNKKLAVWTARDLDSMTRILNATGLNTYFSICVSGNCTSQAKPHPEGLQKISEHFQSEKSSMVMIGDFDSDMMGAKGFGIDSVRVLWHPLAENKKCDLATWQFNQIEEFKDWATTLKR